MSQELGPSTTLRVGLLGMGGSYWIAGVQYLHSILFGNTLLPEQNRSALRLYLDRRDHCASDFREAEVFSCGLHVTEFTVDPALPFYRTIGRIARTAVEHRRLPAWPIFDLPGLLHKNQTDVLFAGTSFHPRIDLPQICWIPDFQHVHRPDFFSAEERKKRDEQFALIMTRANRVVVSNHCSYHDAVRLFPQHRSKLEVLPFTMYLGPFWQNGQVQSVVRKYDLPKKFLLFPSQFWKHKNHLTLFRAIRLMNEQGHKDIALVCTGFPRDSRFPHYAAELEQFVAEHRLDQAVRLLGLLPRHEQVQLMRAASAIVQPSLFEGWSAVVEEARSLGKTVFASDIPMHREQASARMHLFDPNSSEAIADLIARHWPDLQPGPDLTLESLAQTDYWNRIREFARHFNALCRGLAG